MCPGILQWNIYTALYIAFRGSKEMYLASGGTDLRKKNPKPMKNPKFSRSIMPMHQIYLA